MDFFTHFKDCFDHPSLLLIVVLRRCVHSPRLVFQCVDAEVAGFWRNIVCQCCEHVT